MHGLWNGFLHALPSVWQLGQQLFCPATAALSRAESTFRIIPPPATSDYALATLLGKQDCNDLQKGSSETNERACGPTMGCTTGGLEELVAAEISGPLQLTTESI